MKGLFTSIASAANVVRSRLTNNSDDNYDVEFGYSDYDDFKEYDDGEAINVWDAADIWMSSGMDEDYTFGYTEDELKNAL